MSPRRPKAVGAARPPQRQPAPQLVGTELIVDLWEPGAVDLTDPGQVREAILKAAVASRSSVVRSSCHRTDVGGVSAFVLLKESHISIHTWPDRGYVAVDAFTCGNTDCRAAVREIERIFEPRRVEIRAVDRGSPRRQSGAPQG